MNEPSAPSPHSVGPSLLVRALARLRGLLHPGSSPRGSLASVVRTWAPLALVAASSAQLQFDELGKRGLPVDRGEAQSTALGDLDRDGDLDMIVASFGQPARLLLNNGTGTFKDATATRMPPGGSAHTRALGLGDLDRDGDLDLVLGNFYEACFLYLNNGSGTFTDVTATHLPFGYSLQTQVVAIGDVDGNGTLDLILGNSYTNQSRLYLNDGTGRFSNATVLMPSGSYDIRSLALGDVDGDRDLDMLVGIHSGQSRLYLNTGGGRFTDATAALLPVGGYSTTSLALGDADGDGDLDVVLGNYNRQQNRLYLNDGTGRFTDATVARMPVDSDNTDSLALGDVDRDGDLDLLVGNGHHHGEQNRIYLNDGAGTFTDATASRMPVANDYTWSLAPGDVDGDGDLDLVLGNGGYMIHGQRRLYLNDGAGTFADATASRMPVGKYDTRSLVLGDVDRDGDLDLVMGNMAQQNRLYLNDGFGTFADATAARMPVGSHGTTSLVLGDVDGDGDADLVVGNDLQQERLYLNDGAGTFTDATTVRMPAISDNTRALALGDVDGDGDVDLVVGNDYQQNRLYLNDGSGTFADRTAASLPTTVADETRALALGDVDGDGDLDLVLGIAGPNNGQSRLWLNSGNGRFTDVTTTQLPAGAYGTYALALGDVDGDRDLDLFLGNRHTPIRLYLNDGAGTFTDATTVRMPAISDNTNSLAIGDLDRDGDLDLVVGNGNETRQSRVYLNDGTGTFTDATSRLPAALDHTRALAVGDVDRDGDLDLIIGNGAPIVGQSRLYLNLLRQLDAPYVLHIGRNYQLDAYSRYGPATTTDVAFPFLSAGTARIQLPPFGIIGIDITRMIALPAFVIAQPAGIGSLTMPVPNVAALAGATIYTQALVMQQPVQACFTNVIADVVLR